MRLYINDLSFRNDVQIDNPNKLVESFLDVCDRIKKYSFEKIYVPADCKVRELTIGYSLNTFLDNNPRNSLLHQKLKSIMANQFIKIEHDVDAENLIQYVKWNNQESEFLKRAFNTETPVLSFKTIPVFTGHQINITSEYIDENDHPQSENCTLNNLSELSHFTALNAFLNQKQLEIADLQDKWNAIDNPIRFKPRTIQYLADIGYNNKWASANANVKVALANDTGSYIALLNGWEYKSRLSGRNGRKVFKALNQMVYMSIDTQHGTFEIHNRKGIHCYEINFKGDVLEGAQNNHNIEI